MLAAAERISWTWLVTSHGAIRPLPGATSKLAAGVPVRKSAGIRGYSNWSTIFGAGESTFTEGSIWTMLATDGTPLLQTNTM
jgi:hypothetical protein